MKKKMPKENWRRKSGYDCFKLLRDEGAGFKNDTNKIKIFTKTEKKRI
jgi:hypothetical protein